VAIPSEYTSQSTAPAASGNDCLPLEDHVLGGVMSCVFGGRQECRRDSAPLSEQHHLACAKDGLLGDGVRC
jgi:hypothetical protein